MLLIRVMEGEVDLDKRNAAIANAWKIVKDDISYLPLHHQVISWAAKSMLMYLSDQITNRYLRLLALTK